MGSQEFCLRWNNHQSNILTVFDKLLANGSFVDVTLACEGSSLKAHKMVLSACSPFFEEILIENPCKHPVVILRDVKLLDLKAIIEFMYRGEVNVCKDQLGTLIKTAEALKIKGLAEVTNEQAQRSARPSLPVQFCGGRAQVTSADDEKTRPTTPTGSRKRKQKMANGNENGETASDEVQPVDMTHNPRSDGNVSYKNGNSVNKLNDSGGATMVIGNVSNSLLIPSEHRLSASKRNNGSENTSYVNSHSPIKVFPGTPIKHIKNSPPPSPVMLDNNNTNDNNNHNESYIMDYPMQFYRSMSMFYPGQSTAYSHPASGLNLLDCLKNENPPPKPPIQVEIQPEKLIRGRGRSPNWTKEDMKRALQAVMSGHGSKKTARLFNIPWSTLKRYIRRSRATQEPTYLPSQPVAASSTKYSLLTSTSAATVSGNSSLATDLSVDIPQLFASNDSNVADSPSTTHDTSTNSSPNNTPGMDLSTSNNSPSPAGYPKIESDNYESVRPQADDDDDADTTGEQDDSIVDDPDQRPTTDDPDNLVIDHPDRSNRVEPLRLKIGKSDQTKNVDSKMSSV
ncbi:mamo (predicted) [Pycnogonum litorale]